MCELGFAKKVFDGMRERSVVAWNSMISGYEQFGYATEAVALFYRMRDLGVEFDSATFVSVLSPCSQLGAISLGCWVHEYVRKYGFNLNVVLGTALINMNARCGDVTKAMEVLGEDLTHHQNVYGLANVSDTVPSLPIDTMSEDKIGMMMMMMKVGLIGMGLKARPAWKVEDVKKSHIASDIFFPLMLLEVQPRHFDKRRYCSDNRHGLQKTLQTDGVDAANELVHGAKEHHPSYLIG
ncbi:hypothetical protein AgCh_010470 [Apium graveolens]